MTPNERSRNKGVSFEEKPGGLAKSNLVCSSWLNNGACSWKDNGCPGEHPKSMAGIMKGKGQSGKGRGEKNDRGGRKRSRSEDKRMTSSHACSRAGELCRALI